MSDGIRELIDEFRKEHKQDHISLGIKVDGLNTRLGDVERRVLNGITDKQKDHQKRLEWLEQQNIKLLKEVSDKVDRSEISGDKSRTISMVAALFAGASAAAAIGLLILTLLA